MLTCKLLSLIQKCRGWLWLFDRKGTGILGILRRQASFIILNVPGQAWNLNRHSRASGAKLWWVWLELSPGLFGKSQRTCILILCYFLFSLFKFHSTNTKLRAAFCVTGKFRANGWPLLNLSPDSKYHVIKVKSVVTCSLKTQRSIQKRCLFLELPLACLIRCGIHIPCSFSTEASCKQ